MTVQKLYVKNKYFGDGANTVFPITFEWAKKHPESIQVWVRNNAGVLTKTDNFTLKTSSNEDIWNVVYPSVGDPLGQGETITIVRELSLLQVLNLVNQGPFFAEDVEITFDELVMMIQQLNEKLARSFKVAVDIDGENTFDTTVPIEPGKSFRVKDDGTGFEVTEDPAQVLPLAKSELEAVKREHAEAVQDLTVIKDEVESAKTDAQNAANVSTEKAEQVTTDTNYVREQANNIANVLKKTDGYVTPQMFGAKGDGIADDTNAFETALNSGKPIIIPYGTYNITKKLNIPHNTTLLGMGKNTVLKRYTTNADYSNFLMVGGGCDIGNFNIIVQNGTDGSVFDGGVVCINNTTLNGYSTPSANVKTKISDIYCQFGTPDKSITSHDTSFLQLSMMGLWNTVRDGFTGVALNNISVKCADNTTLGYFVHAFSNSSNYWITGITVQGGSVSNTRWIIFPHHTDTNIHENNYYNAQLSILCTQLQSQASNQVKGVCYLSSKCQFDFNNCRFWDYASYNKRMYYFDWNLVVNRNSLNLSWMKFSNTNVGMATFCGVKQDGTEVKIDEYNRGIIGNYVSPISRDILIPKLYGITNGTKYVRLFKGNIASGAKINLSFLYKYDYNTWTDVNITYTNGSVPKFRLSNTLQNSYRLGYRIIDNTNGSKTFEVYLYKSGGIYNVQLLGLPYESNIVGSDNTGAASLYLRTLDMGYYPAEDVYLNTEPNGLVQVAETDVVTPYVFISGTNASGNPQLYKITVENGEIKLTNWYYEY